MQSTAVYYENDAPEHNSITKPFLQSRQIHHYLNGSDSTLSQSQMFKIFNQR